MNEREIHFSDAAGAFTTPGIAPTYTSLNDNITLGYEAYDRIGNVITLISMDMYIGFYTEITQAYVNVSEIDIIWVRNTNGILPVNLYDGTTFLKPEYYNNVEILFQATLFTSPTYDLNNPYPQNTSATINGEQISTFTGNRFTVDLKKLQTTFQSNNGNITDISTGGLFLYTACTQPTEAIDITFGSKLLFI